MNKNIFVTSLLILTACGKAPEVPTTPTTETVQSLTTTVSNSNSLACSEFSIINRNWRNSNFSPSVGVTYTDDLVVTSDCKMKRTYCNQEWTLSSSLNKNFNSWQTISFQVSNVSYDGCFDANTTITCDILLNYDSGLSKWRVLLNCPNTRVPSMSYIEN